MDMKDNDIADKWREAGNAMFSVGKFQEALNAYNKSLCFARTQSKQIALAFGNRSAVYLKVGLYQECLENIQMARMRNHPDPSKLADRETRCLEAQATQTKDPEEDPAKFFKLSYEPNEKLPFIVKCLELKVDKQFGRHIITNRDLKPGDVISIETPTLRNTEGVEARYERCIFCLEKKKFNLIPCDRCSITMFCSESCVKDSMEKFHKYECLLFTMNSLPVDAMTSFYNSAMRFLLETMDTAQSAVRVRELLTQEPPTLFDFDLSKSFDENFDWNRLRTVNGLLPATDSESIERFKEVVEKTVDDASMMLPIPTNDLEVFSEYLLRMMLIFDRNNQGLQIGNGSFCASTVDLFSSLLNHSCVPNTSAVSFGAKKVQFVIKPIKKNEQIFISYSEFIPSRVERRAYLLENYNFHCSCQACLHNYPPGCLMRQVDPHFKSWITELSKTSNWKSRMTKLSNYIEKNFTNYPSREIFKCIDEMHILIASICQKHDWPTIGK